MAKFASIPLKNLVCLVSGGANGLGRATAELLLKSGARTVILDLPHPVTPKEISSKILSASSTANDGTIAFLPADVTSERQTNWAFNQIYRKFGRLDVLVNCAGVGPSQQVYNSTTDQVHSLQLFQNVLRVNLIGTFNMSRQAAQLMGRNKKDANGLRGIIVNAASVASYDSPIGFSAYAASKGGIVSMSLPMARDLADIGVRVVSVATGDMDTSSFAAMRPHVRPPNKAGLPLPERPGRPDEFASAVRTVIETPYLNGCVVRLDGGYSPGVVF